jgi:DNA-binding protein H-NS
MATQKKFTASDIKKMGLTPAQVKKIIKDLESSMPKAKEKAAKATIKAGAKKVVDKTTGKTYTGRGGSVGRGGGAGIGGMFGVKNR